MSVRPPVTCLFFPAWNGCGDVRVRWHIGVQIMASNARTFLAGVLTTSTILALGFGGGLMLAQPAPKLPSGAPTRTSSGQAAWVRVILPASAEPAEPPQPSNAVSSLPLHAQPAPDAQAPIQRKVESAD